MARFSAWNRGTCKSGSIGDSTEEWSEFSGLGGCVAGMSVGLLVAVI